MKIRKVISAGFSASGDSMGTLVDEGIMDKTYEQGLPLTYDRHSIHWTLHENANVIINNGVDPLIYPGDTVVWEK
jgi:hypothetical protein|tara:strand:+ start:2129 stop:2353 length:225 start_codon:yes stop_codon:yes gene_type:complete